MPKYVVSLSSIPGPYEQYSGNVTVYAENEEKAVDNAFIQLKRTSFPDRHRGMWRIKEVKRQY